MAIGDEFNLQGKPLITPASFFHKISEPLPNVAVVTFSIHVKEMVLNSFPHRELENSPSTCNGKIPLYELTVNEKKILFYMTPIGSAMASSIMQEAAYITRARKFVFFGSCGVIDPVKADGKIIIPSESYRDEGFSYHYAPTSDYIKIKNADFLDDYFSKEGIPHIKGRNYCTDAMYMETDLKIKKRKEEGCLSVEMESSGLQALANYLDLDLYLFLFGGDKFLETWIPGDLGGEKEKAKQLGTASIALDLALHLLN